MDYNEAKKIVNAAKPKDNFMLFEFAYDRKFLVPYKAGIALMEGLAQAERLQNGYSDLPRIMPLVAEDIQVRAFSHAEYEKYKIAGLLGLTKDQFNDIKTSENP